MIEKIIIDAATNIAKQGAVSAAHNALGTVNRALAKPHERKMQKIRDEFPEAILLKEHVHQTVKKHLIGHNELVSKVSYLNEDYEVVYKVVGKLEAPIHILSLHHGNLPIGTVTEIPQEEKGKVKAELAYKGKHFVNVVYKVSSECSDKNYEFDDERLKIRWLNKNKKIFEVLYNDIIIMRKTLNEYIITKPENEEKCMLLAMTFLSAESPRWRVSTHRGL